MKQDWLRREPDGPHEYLLDACRGVKNGFVFLHVREPEGITRLLQLGKQRGVAIETIHVMRPGYPIPDNPIDSGTLGFQPYDLYVENNAGLNELRTQAQQYVLQRIPTASRLR